MKDEKLDILSAAARSGDVETVEYVLKKGERVQSSDMQDALVIAAARNYVEIGRLLIKHGANIDYEASKAWPSNERNGRSPIFNAVESGAFDFVHLLASCGADFDIFEDRGYTPLMATYYYCRPREKSHEMLNFLLEYGADPYLKGRNDNSFADLVQEKGNSDDRSTNVINNAIVDSGMSMFNLSGRYGVRFNEKTIIPPYFSSMINSLPYATYCFHKTKSIKDEKEIILLYENILDDSVKMGDIGDYYSSVAEMWLYDSGQNHFRIYGYYWRDDNDIVRIFKNGLYYLYSLVEEKIISNGYSEIFETEPENIGVMNYRLGKFFGFLSINGKELVHPVLTDASDILSEGRATGYIERLVTDSYEFVFERDRYNEIVVKEKIITKWIKKD